MLSCTKKYADWVDFQRRKSKGGCRSRICIEPEKVSNDWQVRGEIYGELYLSGK